MVNTTGLVIVIGLFLATSGLWTPVKAAEEKSLTAKVYDAGKHYPGNWTAWRECKKNRAAWKQVPYGKTDIKCAGDAVLENKFFYIYFTANSQNDMHVKRGNRTLMRNILYKTYYDPKEYKIEKTPPGKMPGRKGVHYGDRTLYTKVLKNTPEEVVVENQGKKGKGKFPITATYRILHDKPWVEIKGVNFVTDQGIHGKLRIAICPNEKGNDYVLDSLRDPCGRPKAPPCKMIIGPYESGTSPFLWVITFSSPFKEAAPHFINDSGPKGDRMWWHGTAGAPRTSQGCITSSWAKFGRKGSVVIGGLPYWHNWHRDEINKPIKKGEVYTSKWKPPYPGKWRMTVRLAEKKYDQGFRYDGKTKFPAKHFSKEVNDGNFTFTSPIDGWLDYVIMYMYDRTIETPKEILTPMDQYRWTIQQRKRNES